MSDTGMELDLKRELARIDRDRAESNKLAEETRKFVAEQHKLMAEAAKLNRDRWLAPTMVMASVLAAVGGVTAAVVTLMRASGSLP